MKIWNRLKEFRTIAPYNYGLNELEGFLKSKDYGWTEPDESHKKVILTNPLDCREKICLKEIVFAWHGTGHFEWEAILGGWFIQAVLDAIEKNVNEADITHLFNRDFLASCNLVFTQTQVYNHLIKWFDIVEETDEVLKVRFHI